MKPIILLCCIFVAGSLAASNDGKCATHCSGIATKFRYQKGTTYTYKYESETKVQLAGTSQNAATVNIDATAKFSFVDGCEWALKISDVKIRGPSPAQLGSDWVKELEKAPTSFSYDDGEIEDICPAADEPAWATNIKRGILSTFQLAHDTDAPTMGEYETDVTGRCPTTYERKQEGGALTIYKSKDLMACFDHSNNYTSVRMVNYDVRSVNSHNLHRVHNCGEIEKQLYSQSIVANALQSISCNQGEFRLANIQNLPLVDCKQQCRHTIQRDISTDIACTETHTFLPFRNEQRGGVKATVTTKLHFNNEDKNVIQAKPGDRKSLRFDDHELLWAESTDALAQARDTLKTLCTTTVNDVRPNTPDNFAELVYEFKRMSAADLKTLATEMSSKADCPKGKKFVIDALPMCGSTGCVTFMTELLSGRGAIQLTPWEQKGYFAGLAFTSHPTKDMVKAATEIVSTVPSNGLYGITSMVNGYCRLHPGCENVAEVKAFVQKYLTLLSGWTPTKPIAQSGNTVDALRAFGNLGYVTDGTMEKLKFLTENKNHIDIRLAAIQSLRRTPTSPQLATALFTIFDDDKENVEIRLNAFLILIDQDISEEMLNKIVDSAFAESELNQIQSFVSSYIRQVRESNDPSKEDLKHKLDSLAKKLPGKGFDPRKYSRYFETSYFDYDYNMGGHVDSSVIFTPDSFLPKQASLNLTIDLFGSEINLLELGVRTDHLDDTLDQLFGPEGYYTNPTAFYFKEGAKPLKNPKIKELQDTFNKGKKPKSGLDLSMYMRVYGDEMVFKNYHDIPLIDQFQQAVNPTTMLGAMAKEKTVNLAYHRMPLDTVVTVPVISGLPLRFDLNGTVVMNLDLSAKADLLSVVKGSADVKLMLKPSAAAQMAAQLAIWTGKVKSGVRITKNMHTSTAATLTILAENAQSIKAKLEFPNNKLEVADMETHLFTIVNDVPTEEKGVPTRSEKTFCTPDRFSKALGFKLCSHTSYPNASGIRDAPFYPLTGPSQNEIYFEKADAGLKSYELTANWKTTPTGRTVKLSFNTPGSQTDREMTLDYNYERGKSVNAELKTPFKKVKATGTLETTGDKTKGKINVNVDQARDYSVTGTMDKTVLPENGVRYVFDSQVTAPALQTPGTLKGTAERTPGKKAMLDFTIDKVYTSPVEFKATIEKSAAQGSKYVLTSSIKCPKMNTKINGLANVQSVGNMDYNLDFEYQRVPTDATPHKLTYYHKHAFQRGDKTFKLSSNSKFSSSWYPDINDGYDFTMDRAGDKLETQFAFMDNDQKGLIFNTVSQIKPNDVKTTLTLQYPKTNLNQKAEVVYRNLYPKEFEASVLIEDVTAKKQVQAKASLKNNRQDIVDAQAELLLKTPEREIKAFRTTKETTPGTYDSTTTIQWEPTKKMEIKSTAKGQKNDWEIKANINYPGAQPLEFFKKFKTGQGVTKYITYLKSQANTLFDINVDAIKEGDVKTNVKATVKTNYDTIKLDTGLDGFYENLPIGKRVSGTILKDGKDYMKTEIIVPKDWSHQSDKQIKVGTIWGLPAEPKEFLYEHKMTKAGAGHLHDTTLKLDVPDANYQLNIKRKHDDSRTMNITLLKKNSPLVEISTGRTVTKQRDPKSYVGDYAADVMIKTYAPMDVRHLVGNYHVNVADKGVKADLTLNSVTDNQKVGLEVSWNKKDETSFEKSLGITVNNYRIKTRNLGSVQKGPQGEYAGGKVEGEAEWNTQDNQQKKFTWNVAGSKTKIDAQFTTPSTTAPKITFKAEKTLEGKKEKRVMELTWGSQKINMLLNRESEENYLNSELTIDTTLDSLKKYQHALKYDARNKREASLKISWNTDNKINANFLRATEGSNEKWDIGAEAKVGTALDWATSTSATWNQAAGTYVTKNLVRTDATKQYKADVDLNTKTMDAKVNMENVPGITGPVKAQAKKLGDNEYELKLTDNAGANKGMIAFKLTPENQKFKIDTTAFKSNYESEWKPTKWSILGEVTTDPNAPTKSYGIQISNEIADQTGRDTVFSFTYPQRKLSFRSKRGKLSPEKYTHDVEINLNAGKREPAKFSWTKTPQSLELHVIDPKLPQGFHIVGKKTATGDFATTTAPWSAKFDVSIKYSADPKKEIKITKESKRELVGPRRKITGRTELVQEANNLNHKLWSEMLLEPCTEGKMTDCDYVFELGTQFPDAQKQPSEYSIKIKTTLLKGTYSVVFAKDKYDVEKTTVGTQRTYSVSKNKTPLYDAIFELIRVGEKTAAFSLVKKPTNEVLFHISASLPSNDIASFKVYHDESGTTVKDIEWTIKLEESDRLKMKFYKRPGMTKALKDLSDKYMPAGTAAAAVPQIAVASKAINEDIAKELKPMFDDWMKEETDIAKELKIEGGHFSENLRDEIDMITKKLNTFVSTFNEYTSGISSAVQNMVRTWIDTGKKLAAQLPEAASKMAPAFNEMKTKVQARTKAFRDNVQTILGKVYADLKLQDVIDFITRSWNQVPNAGIVQKLRTLLANIKAMFPEVKGDSVLADMKMKVKQIYFDRIKQFQDGWQKVRQDLLKNEDTKEYVAIIDAIIAYLQRASQYVDPDKGGKEIVGDLGEWYRKYANETYQTKGFKFERPSEGLVVIEMPLPAHYNSLTDLGKSFTPKRLRGLAHRVEESVNGLTGAFDDDDSSEFFTPHQASALVFGDQYFETFDGKVITFSGDCSYLLARDFENGKFTISVDFEQKQGRSARKSITVEYGEDKIELLYNGKVNINGKTGDLPWHKVKEDFNKALIKVKQATDDIIVLETFDGLKVKCDAYYHVCSIKLSGRFHGKTKGLLGMNDGEPNDDLTLPDGNKATDMATFASTWALDQQCARGPNRAVVDGLPKDHPDAKECEHMFKDSSSPLRSCFRSTPPNEFYEICLQQMKTFTQTQRDPARKNEGICDITAAYIKTCGQTLDMPTQCIHCEIPEVLKLYETKQVKTDLIDVVFVVEERQCMAWVKTKLVSMAQKMEGSMKNVHYGLVGFNGEGVHYLPHFHTGNGQVNMDIKGLQLAVAQLAYPDTDPKPLQNPMTAIEFVSEKYPFRGGSRKLLGLLACNNCEGFQVDYYSLQSTLLGEDITMHMITTQKVELSEGKADVIGFDGRIMITGDKREDAEIRKQLVEPHDSCTVLAQETNGTVFSYSEKNSNSIIELFAAKVAKTAQPSRCAVCECRSEKLHAHTVCLPCEIPTPASLAKDNTGFFNNPFKKLQKWQNKAQDVVMMADAPAVEDDLVFV